MWVSVQHRSEVGDTVDPEVCFKISVEGGEDLPRILGESQAVGGEDDEAASAAFGVELQCEEVVPDEPGDQALGGLPGVAQATSQFGRGHTLGVEVGEDQGLGWAKSGPASALESVEELLVEPAAGSEEQERERNRRHPATITSYALLSGHLTKE